MKFLGNNPRVKFQKIGIRISQKIRIQIKKFLKVETKVLQKIKTILSINKPQVQFLISLNLKLFLFSEKEDQTSFKVLKVLIGWRAGCYFQPWSQHWNYFKVLTNFNLLFWSYETCDQCVDHRIEPFDLLLKIVSTSCFRVLNSSFWLPLKFFTGSLFFEGLIHLIDLFGEKVFFNHLTTL